MTLFWGRNGDMWQPQGGERRHWRDLKAGDLIAAERQVWCVREVRPVPVIDWDEHDREYYAAHGRHRGAAPISEEDWVLRPLYLIIVPVAGGKRRHVKARPYAHALAYVLSPHYPVCRECGEVYPCRHLEIDAEAKKQMARVTKLESILPGCCWCCGKPVTSKQKSIVFEGENLLLPGAPPPVFHMRGGKPYCSSAAIDYEKKWVKADPARHPRLHCPGSIIIHVDGAECSEDPFCPGPQVNHPSMMNHRAYAAYARRCLRCKDACARMGIAIPEAAD